MSNRRLGVIFGWAILLIFFSGQLLGRSKQNSESPACRTTDRSKQTAYERAYGLGDPLLETGLYKLYGRLTTTSECWCKDGNALLALVYKVDEDYEPENNAEYWRRFEAEIIPAVSSRCKNLKGIRVEHYIQGVIIISGIDFSRPDLTKQDPNSVPESVAIARSSYQIVAGSSPKKQFVYGTTVAEIKRFRKAWPKPISKEEADRQYNTKFQEAVAQNRDSNRTAAQDILKLSKRNAPNKYDFSGYKNSDTLESIYTGNFRPFTGDYPSPEQMREKIIAEGNEFLLEARHEATLNKVVDGLGPHRGLINSSFYNYQKVYRDMCRSNEEMEWGRSSLYEFPKNIYAFGLNPPLLRTEYTNGITAEVRKPFLNMYDQAYRRLASYDDLDPISKTDYDDFKKFLTAEGCSSPTVRQFEINIYLAAKWLLPLQVLRNPDEVESTRETKVTEDQHSTGDSKKQQAGRIKPSAGTGNKDTATGRTVGSSKPTTNKSRAPITEKDKSVAAPDAELRLHNRWAKMLEKSGEEQTVISETSSALDNNPHNVFALRMRSGAYFAVNNDEKAKADAESIISSMTDPKTGDDFEALCYSLHRLGKLNEAAAACARAVELSPNSMWVYVDRGGIYLANKNYEHAVADLTKAIKINPASPLAYNDRARVYIGKEEYDLALADVAKAIETDARNSTALVNRGIIHSKRSDFDSATIDFDNAIRISPDNASAYAWRGTTYQERRDYDRANADFSKAIGLDPKSLIAFRGRGALYYSKDDFDRAIADFTKVIELDPADKSAFNYRGLSYHRKRDFSHAIADFTHLIEMDPTNASAYANRGTSNQRINNNDQAINDFSKSLELDPKVYSSYTGRGIIYLYKQDYVRAVSDLTKAIELNPQISFGYELRGRAYDRMKIYDLAINDYTKVIDLDPKLESAYRSRADIYDKIGKADLAIADRKKANEIKR